MHEEKPARSPARRSAPAPLPRNRGPAPDPPCRNISQNRRVDVLSHEAHSNQRHSQQTNAPPIPSRQRSSQLTSLESEINALVRCQLPPLPCLLMMIVELRSKTTVQPPCTTQSTSHYTPGSRPTTSATVPRHHLTCCVAAGQHGLFPRCCSRGVAGLQGGRKHGSRGCSGAHSIGIPRQVKDSAPHPSTSGESGEQRQQR